MVILFGLVLIFILGIISGIVLTCLTQIDRIRKEEYKDDKR